VALVINSPKDTVPTTLVVRAPPEIASENRSGFRVPILKGSAPLVQILSDESMLSTPRALDISVTGILVEFPPAEAPEFPIDTKVRLKIRFEDTALDLKGLVRRKQGGRYGIFFPEVIKGIHIEPPEALAKIVRKLEAIWLRQRIY
jgi:hypothetical protein